MVLNFIALRNFRLHTDTQLEFSNSINFIIGGNGQGKTSLLEAVYYLCTSKSMGQSSDVEAVSFGEDFFEVNGSFHQYSMNRIKVLYEAADGKKSIFIDGKQIYRASGLIGKFPVVALLQSDHAITQGSPAERRRFVDSIIAQSSITYLKLLLDYNKILRNRSALLSKIKEYRSSELLRQLDVWTESLVIAGSEIIKHRFDFVREFNDYIAQPYKHIMGKSENPNIIYLESAGCNQNNVQKEFEQKLFEYRDDELRRARNLVGPHRDDFNFLIEDLELKKFGSQGQNKTFQIALRFSQFFYLKEKLGITPIFLMDDVFGELDSSRAKKISNYLSEIGQAFITMTDFSNLDNLDKSEDDKIFNVSKGNVAYA